MKPYQNISEHFGALWEATVENLVLSLFLPLDTKMSVIWKRWNHEKEYKSSIFLDKEASVKDIKKRHVWKEIYDVKKAYLCESGKN